MRPTQYHIPADLSESYSC